MPRAIGALQRQPSTFKKLYENRFSFLVHNLPEVTYSCQRANIPGLSISPVTSSNPNTQIRHPGNLPSFEPLSIQFMVDQNLANWREIYDWIRAASFPKDTVTDRIAWLRERTELFKGLNGLHSDATIIIRNSQLNFIAECLFTDVFPVSISSLDFDTRTEANDILVATAIFYYTQYEIRDVRPIR